MSVVVHGPIACAGSSALALGAVQRSQATDNVREVKIHGSGIPEPGLIMVAGAEPMLDFDTVEVAAVLTALGFTGKAIGAAAYFTGFTQYWSVLEDDGLRVAGSNHYSAACTKGLIYPRELSWSGQEVASLSVGVCPDYDGTNAIVQWASGVALPSVTISEAFFGGPVKIGGTLYPQELLTGVKLDFGVQVQRFAGSGEVDPRRCHILRTIRRIELSTARGVNRQILGRSAAVGAGETAFYLTRGTPDGERVAAATATHVKITVAASQGLVVSEGPSGQNNDPATPTISIHPRKGTLDGLSFSATATIPTS